MTTLKQIYKKGAGKVRLLTLNATIIAAGAMMMTSCNDFLDTLPLNDVVLEKYWTKKNDVTSVLNSCYESLESKESIRRMGLWGEVRSENMVQGNNAPYDLTEILKENILPTNSYTKWDIMYTTINYCNTVCHYAPQVNEKDPNYTVSEMQANIAEATFLRDLCYFYLIRTFRDVPVSFEPSIDDLKDYQLAPTKMNDALDMLIDDLKKVENWAVKRYIDDSEMMNTTASTRAYENNSRVTRVAIYALLADLNLWRGNYQATVDYCDKVIEFKKEQYKLKKEKLGDLHDMGDFNGIPLILEKTEGSTTCGTAYNQIFGTGHSFESLFELYFKNNQAIDNDYVATCFGTGSQPLGNLSAPDHLRKDAALGNCELWDKNDCRVYENIGHTSSKYNITKYVNTSVTLTTTNISDEKSLKLSTSLRGNKFSQWIVYRLTDVMLMKAEALIMMGDSKFEEAFSLINSVNKRARHLISKSDKDTLVYTNYNSSQKKMEKLLMDERNREFMFEGKRWFDLVRVSLRDGNTQFLTSEATTKYQENVNAIKIRLSDPDYIFFPYNREELKLNPNLKQNPAYGDTEDFIK